MATSYTNMPVYISVTNCKLLSISDLLTICSRQQGVDKSVLFCEKKMIPSQTLTFGEQKATLRVKVMSKAKIPQLSKKWLNRVIVATWAEKTLTAVAMFNNVYV